MVMLYMPQTTFQCEKENPKTGLILNMQKSSFLSVKLHSNSPILVRQGPNLAPKSIPAFHYDTYLEVNENGYEESVKDVWTICIMIT